MTTKTALFKIKGMKGLPSLKSLLFELEKLPGLGPVSAQRLARHILKAEDRDIRNLARSLMDLKDKITVCPQCFHYMQDRQICAFCEDPSRDRALVCVVEQAFDVFRVEACGAFKGRYHVLQGAISPLNHIHPKDLTLSELESRVERENIKELILALDSDLEGDTTALYIMQNFRKADLKISRLAQGIPLGSDLNFIDDRTLGQAIENRTAQERPL